MESSQSQNIQKIEVYTYAGEDFRVLKEFEGWKVGFLKYSDRFSEVAELERHIETDEVFLLLSGTATLYTETEQKRMEKNMLYNIPKGMWHHIVVSEDALVLVIENSNTTRENTEKKRIEQGGSRGQGRSRYVN